MSVGCIAQNLLQRQLLTLDTRDREILANAVVVVAGIGGIGCAALEVLARNAVGSLILADIDVFDATNARQLYMTQHTIGLEKAAVARARVSEINPDANVRAYGMGITPANVREICAGAHAICDQVDQLAANILLHVIGDRFRIPVVSASRTRWPERHFLGVKVYDYRRPAQHFDVKTIDITNRWGVDEALVCQLLTCMDSEQPCDALIREINEQNQRFRAQQFREVLAHGDATCISDKRREYLLEVADGNPQVFHKMVISPEEAIVMGCLAGAAVKDLLLGRAPAFFEMNLYHGSVQTPGCDDVRAIHEMSAQQSATEHGERVHPAFALAQDEMPAGEVSADTRMRRQMAKV